MNIFAVFVWSITCYSSFYVHIISFKSIETTVKSIYGALIQKHTVARITNFSWQTLNAKRKRTNAKR